ncbi:MAG: hypothetical protein ACK5WC_11765 [Aphanizomenon sp.]|jgi:hypothetical protein
MNYTSSTEHENVIKNIEPLNNIWKRRCEAFKKNNKGDCGRHLHLLFILNDLREELENNKSHFSRNSYAKTFFKLQVNNYCNICNEKSSALDKTKRKWAKEVNSELSSIVQVLCGGTQEDIPNLTEHINNIINQLTSDSHFQKTIDILYQQLFKRDLVNDQIEFLVDTLIILFNRRGKIGLYFELQKQLQTIEQSIYDVTILENNRDLLGIDSTKQIFLSPQVWGSPLKNGQSPNEYKEEVRNYYSNLSIKQRLDFLKNIYCQDPRSHTVIFNLKGWDFSEKFPIGEMVTFYKATENNRYIVNNCQINKWYSQFSPNPNNFEINDNFYVAVNIKGIDTKSMIIEARKIAERIIGVILTDKIDKHDVILSNDWIICNSQGEICDFQREEAGNITTQRDNKITSKFNKYDPTRLVQWISLGNEYHLTIKRFLSSIDCYKRSVESSQVSQRLLNSWFAMEMFRKDSQGLTEILPSPSEKLLKKHNIKETKNSWLSEDIGKLQLILVISKLKFNLFTKVREYGTLLSWDILTIYEIDNIDNIDKALIQEILRENYESDKEWLFKILEISPRLEQKLKNENKELKCISRTNEIFYNHQQCEDYLFNEILKLKDDVYNIYRIRNMLVHSGNTESSLLDYYGERSLEYCYSILDIIAYKIFQTASDDEIKPLESYFQEILIEATKAIESVKENKMDKFRDWVLS